MPQNAHNAKQTLIEFKSRLDPILDSLLQEEINNTEEFGPLAIEYMQELKNLVMNGGKRLRGAFVYYSYLMNGGKDEEEILKVAAVIEIIHTFLLIEDDFMDLGSERRGYKTIHETYKEKHTEKYWSGDPVHFGHSIAVTVGLAADHLALSIFNDLNFPCELKMRAMNKLHRQLITTCHGQIHDIINGAKNNVSEKNVLDVLYWKTGVYTYENPLQIGAILSGASKESLEALSRYAIPSGIAFQIQDDILGSFGDTVAFGKSASDDITEGKKTLLVSYAMENASSAQLDVLKSVLGKLDASPDQVDQVREVFVQTGALDYAKQKAIKMVEEAKLVLENTSKYGWEGESVEFIRGIAEYMIARQI